MPRAASALALVLGPAALLLIFGLSRTAPPMADCGDQATPQHILDAYRSGLLAIFVVAEILALAVLVAGLRAAPAGSRLPAWIIPPVGAAAGFAAIAIHPGLAVPAGVLVLVALHAIAGPPRGQRASVIALAAVPAAIAAVGVLAVLVAVMTNADRPQLAIVLSAGTLIAALWLLLEPEHRRAGAGQAAAAAALVMLLVLPTIGAIVFTRGDGFALC